MTSDANKKIYPTHKAKAQLSQLIRDALNGVEIFIAKGSTPLVKLIPVERKKSPRKFGLLKGEYYMSDDFNEPLEAFKEYENDV